MTLGRRSWIHSLLVALLACGCSSWKVAKGTVPTVLEEKPRERIRLELRDGTEFVLLNPELRGDSLYGQKHVTYRPEGDRFYRRTTRDVVVPLSQIKLVETRQGDALKVVGIGFGVIGLAALVGLILIAIALSKTT